MGHCSSSFVRVTVATIIALQLVMCGLLYRTLHPMTFATASSSPAPNFASAAVAPPASQSTQPVCPHHEPAEARTHPNTNTGSPPSPPPPLPAASPSALVQPSTTHASAPPLHYFEDRSSHFSSERDLVMAFCDITAKDLYRFLGSFRRTGSHAQIICFHVKPIVDEAIKLVYRRFGPILIEPFGTVPVGVSPVNYRFVVFGEYLTKHHSRFDRIILADARDLIFQTDPFEWVPAGPQQIVVTQEYMTAGHTLGGNSVNARWIAECFGVDSIRELGKHWILCSGVIAGGIDAILKFFQLQTTNLARDSRCVDQAVLNWLYYTNTLSQAGMNVTLIGVETGPVLHTYELTCNIAGNSDSVDRFGWIWNLHRTRIASVVHQYDRCPTVVEKVDRQLPYDIGYIWGTVR